MGFTGNFPMSFPVLCIDSLNEFLKARKSVGLVVVDHIIFDALGKSIVSLFLEHCVAPLDS